MSSKVIEHYSATYNSALVEQLVDELRSCDSNVHKNFWVIGSKLNRLKVEIHNCKGTPGSEKNAATDDKGCVPNFSDFVFHRVGKKICRRFVYHLIAAAEIMDNLSQARAVRGWDRLPANERQCREMKSLNLKQQVIVWETVLMSKLRITNTLIRRTVSRLFPKHNSNLGDNNRRNFLYPVGSLSSSKISRYETSVNSPLEKFSDFANVPSADTCYGSDLSCPPSPAATHPNFSSANKHYDSFYDSSSCPSFQSSYGSPSTPNSKADSDDQTAPFQSSFSITSLMEDKQLKVSSTKAHGSGFNNPSTLKQQVMNPNSENIMESDDSSSRHWRISSLAGQQTTKQVKPLKWRDFETQRLSQTSSNPSKFMYTTVPVYTNDYHTSLGVPYTNGRCAISSAYNPSRMQMC